MDEQQLDRLISEYLQASERGEAVNPQQLINQNPQFADELRSFFEGKRVFDAALGKSSGSGSTSIEATIAENSDVDPPDRSKLDAKRDSSGVYIRDYQLLEKLGEGGMGAVFLALHTQLQKRVAIKVLKSELESDLSAKKRFQNEMRAVGRFEHDNIVRALDAGRTKEGYYLVMEFIEGANLSQILRRCGPLQIADACEVIRQSAIGLAHAHYLGIIHRDIKPSNLMLTPSGQIKLLDLGLAQLRLAHLTSELTVDGHVLGTLKYMPPEQLEGKKVDQTCDVYSLGVTLLELVLGDLPPIAVGHGIDWSRLHDRCEFIPAELIALIQQMTAVDRSQRPQSASDVAERLQQWSSENDLAAIFRSFREQADDHQIGSRTRPPQAPPLHASSESSVRTWNRKKIATIAICCLVGLLLATVVYRSNRSDPVVVPSGPIDATLSVILEQGTVADPSRPLPVVIHQTTGDAFRLTEGLNELPPGSYSMESDRWESSVSFPIALDEGEQRSTLLFPKPPDSPSVPVHLPEIPKQPGSWVTYTAHRVTTSPPAPGEREGAGQQSKHSYRITMRSLQQEKIDDRSYRWIQIEIMNSEYAETARLLIDETLYDLEQRLSIREGYIESTVLDDASGLFNFGGPRPVLLWSDDVDPFKELADDYRVALPVSRISTASLLSMFFGHIHPSVPAVFNDMRSLLGSSTTKSVEETTFKTQKGNEIPALKVTASGEGQESNTGYTIVRGKNADQSPFSFLRVHIEMPYLQVTLDQHNWRSTGDVIGVNVGELESRLIALDEIDNAEEEDFIRASLPEKEGEYAEYVASIKRDGKSTDVTAVVRAGAQESFRGKPCRWIEVQLNQQERERITTEKVSVLVDEKAYRDDKSFTFYQGWLQLGGETFDFFGGDATPAEEALAFLKKDVQSQRLRVHEVLTLLFDAQLPSSTTRSLRSTIEIARAANFSGDSSEQRPKWTLCNVRKRNEKVRCIQLVFGPSELNNQSVKYELLWSGDTPFGFVLVDLSSQSSNSTRSTNAFEITTSLVNFGSDASTLIGDSEELQIEAENTLRKLQNRNVRFWKMDDEVHAGEFERGSYDAGKTAIKLFNGTAYELFENLSRADQQWILENESLVWQRKQGDAVRGIFHEWLHSEGKIRILSVDNEFVELPRDDFSPEVLQENTKR